MQFDINHTPPSPGSTSECPLCHSKLIAKCGSIKIWHWAHESLKDCDGWYEPMSQWHLDWQSLVPEELREVIVGRHIADIKLPSGKVIEIQHSSLSVETVAERESFYDNMTWVFDGSEFTDRFIIKEKYDDDNNQLIYHTFRFKNPRKYILSCKKLPIYIDFGEEVFQIKKFKQFNNWSEAYGKEYITYAGWGHLKLKDHFLFHELFGVSYTPRPEPVDGSSS